MEFFVSVPTLTDKLLKDKNKKFDYDPDFLFCFYGKKLGSDKLTKIKIKLSTIKSFSIFNVKKINKKNYFCGFIRLGLIETNKKTYNTDQKYVLLLKNYYFHKKNKQSSKKKVKDKTKSGKIISKYDVTYNVIKE